MSEASGTFFKCYSSVLNLWICHFQPHQLRFMVDIWSKDDSKQTHPQLPVPDTCSGFLFRHFWFSFSPFFSCSQLRERERGAELPGRLSDLQSNIKAAVDVFALELNTEHFSELLSRCLCFNIHRNVRFITEFTQILYNNTSSFWGEKVIKITSLTQNEETEEKQSVTWWFTQRTSVKTAGSVLRALQALQSTSSMFPSHKNTLSEDKRHESEFLTWFKARSFMKLYRNIFDI